MSGHDPADLWRFLFIGYVCTVVLEALVLFLGLSARHSWKTRAIASLWLTACTYPIVALVLPLVIEPTFGRLAYLIVAETFAPLAEVTIFYFAFDRQAARREIMRDAATIVVANLFSFGVGFALT